MTLQEIGRREHRHVGPPHGVSQVVISCSWGSSDGAVITPTVVPRKSPERKQEFIGPGEERRHAHVDGAAYRLAQVAEQADRV